MSSFLWLKQLVCFRQRCHNDDDSLVSNLIYIYFFVDERARRLFWSSRFFCFLISSDAHRLYYYCVARGAFFFITGSPQGFVAACSGHRHCHRCRRRPRGVSILLSRPSPHHAWCLVYDQDRCIRLIFVCLYQMTRVPRSLCMCTESCVRKK